MLICLPTGRLARLPIAEGTGRLSAGAIRLHLVPASFVAEADGFVATFGLLTEWKHAYRAGRPWGGVGKICVEADLRETNGSGLCLGQ